MTPRIRAKRILSHMDRYRAIGEAELNNPAFGLGLKTSADWICLYYNEPGSLENAVVIKDPGIEILSSTTTRAVRYEDIESTSPLKNDGSDEEITAMLFNGERFAIPIHGRNGRFQDIFEFSRFLSRSVSDVRSRLND